MEKLTLNHRKGRKARQAKQGETLEPNRYGTRLLRLCTRSNKRTTGSRLKDGSYRVRIIQTAELGNPYVFLFGGKEFARTT